jgi:tellurite resistance protein TerC
MPGFETPHAIASELGQHLQDLAQEQVHQRCAHGHEHDGCPGSSSRRTAVQTAEPSIRARQGKYLQICAIWRLTVEITALGWALTIAVILGLLALDLVLGTVRPHAVDFREATAWSLFYIATAIVFGLVFANQVGWDYGTQYFAGYIVEKSLSVDNLFVFVIIMSTFAVPREHQHKVLTFGITAALVLRAIFIALGATLLSLFSFMFLIFGLLLIWTAVQLYRHRNEDPDVESNPLTRVTRRLLPVTNEYVDGRLLARVDGRRVVTPLFIVLITIGGTDILFALDSIPAVFGVTEEPYIVFVANAFALLGLRALFFLVTGLLDRLVYLSTGLALILAFIGVKLILHWGHGIDHRVPEIPTTVSLGVIVGVLTVTTVASLIKHQRDPTARAHAGVVVGAEPRDATDEHHHPAA